jgi:hypothetical protein
MDKPNKPASFFVEQNLSETWLLAIEDDWIDDTEAPIIHSSILSTVG